MSHTSALIGSLVYLTRRYNRRVGARYFLLRMAGVSAAAARLEAIECAARIRPCTAQDWDRTLLRENVTPRFDRLGNVLLHRDSAVIGVMRTGQGENRYFLDIPAATLSA